MKTKFSFFFIFVLFCAFCVTAAAQEAKEEEKDETVYVIASFSFNKEGQTKIFALVSKAELKTGVEITGKANLEKYVQEKTQMLLNQRVLESASIDYQIGSATADGKYPVSLTVNTKDTWNLIAIPRPQFDSNSGVDITIKARDYNFFGTMNPLRVDVGYRYDEHERTFFNLMVDSYTPFKLFNLNWYLTFYNFFEYRPDMSEPFHFANTTGLAVDFPIGNTTLTIGFNEAFIIHEANSETDMINYSLGDIQKGFFMSSRPSVSWRIPTTIQIAGYGELIYSLGLTGVINHEITEPLDETRIGPFMNFNHNLGFGRIDWIGNFRNGFSMNVSNSYGFDFYRYNNNEQALSASLSAAANAHYNYEDHFEISARALYRHWFFTDTGHTSAGDVLRGIIDKNVSADIMFSLNFDLTIGAIKFRASELISPKLSFFDFDMHLSPFIDLAVYRSPFMEAAYPNADFSYKNILASCGVEVVLFPLFMRSLFLRVSLGFNVSMTGSTGSRELFIGTELHY